MRHAQYRLELADTVAAACGLPVALERAVGVQPTLCARWTGSQLTRGSVGGWLHSYELEVAAEFGDTLDSLVGLACLAVAGWQPNTSHATATGPTARPVRIIDGEVSYAAVIISTTVTEPSTD